MNIPPRLVLWAAPVAASLLVLLFCPLPLHAQKTGTTLLKTDTAVLKAASVTGRKKYLEQRIDRTVLNIGALLSNTGSTALEALQNAPGVALDDEGNISLKGRAGVTVFIDDKPSYLSGADLISWLRSLPASTLDKIELMSNPPANYDASGSGGIINIRTKREKTEGLYGNLTTGFGQGSRFQTNTSLNLNYRNRRFNLFSNLNTSRRDNFALSDRTRHFEGTGTGQSSRILQHIHELSHQWENGGRLGLDYFLSRRTTLGGTYEVSYNPYRERGDYHTRFFGSKSTPDSTLLANSRLQTTRDDRQLNVNFRHRFDSASSQLTFDMDYISFTHTGNQSLLSGTTLPDYSVNGQDTLHIVQPHTARIWSLKTDYTHRLPAKIQLETGLKSSFSRLDNTSTYLQTIDNREIADAGRSNHFRYNETILAGYLSLNRELSKYFSAKAGLRLEHTLSKGESQALTDNPSYRDSSFAIRYTDIFPTLYLSYNAGPHAAHHWSFSYGKRIERPEYSSLNPAVFYFDRYNYFIGNPYLKPEYSQNLEFSDNYKDILTTTLLYSHTAGGIGIYYTQSGDTLFRKPANINSSSTLGVSADLSLSPAPWWTANLHAEIMSDHYQGILLQGQRLDTTALHWTFTGNSQFNLEKGWSTELSWVYRSKRPNGQVVFIAMWWADLSVRKKVLNSRGSVGMTIRDLFHTRRPGLDVFNIPLTAMSIRNGSDTRTLSLVFSYRFGRIKDRTRQHEGGAETEHSRL